MAAAVGEGYELDAGHSTHQGARSAVYEARIDEEAIAKWRVQDGVTSPMSGSFLETSCSASQSNLRDKGWHAGAALGGRQASSRAAAASLLANRRSSRAGLYDVHGRGGQRGSRQVT